MLGVRKYLLLIIAGVSMESIVTSPATATTHGEQQ